MKNLSQFQENAISKSATANVKGGIRFTTLDRAKCKRKKIRLKARGVNFTKEVVVCPLTGIKTYCIEW